jgi:hypothetical protein
MQQMSLRKRMAANLVLAFAAAVLVTEPALAQIARVAGTVTDQDGRPLKGATVTAENPDHTPSTLTASTDDRGRYSMIGFRLGVYRFTVAAPGYETASIEMNVVTVRPNPPLNARLKKSATPEPTPFTTLDARDIQRRIDAAEGRATAGELDAAVNAYRQLLSNVPALTSVYLRIGQLLERKGDAAAAIGAYEQLLALEPHNARARAALDRMKKGV